MKVSFLTVLAWLLVVVPGRFCSAAAEGRPNIVIILTDDQGRGDYSAFGTPDIRTPNIDRLFKEGITFDNF